MSLQDIRTVKLSHQQVVELCQSEIEKHCKHPVPCKYFYDDFNIWEIGFRGYRLPLSELFQLFEVLGADDNARKQSLPDEVREDVNGIGTDVSKLLLEQALKLTWEQELSDSDFLWLIDVKPLEKKADERMFLYKNTIVNLDHLKTKDEAIAYIEDNGGNYSALQNFDENYSPTYNQQLYWHFPIVTDNLFTGTYFLLVREGVLTLPYNIVDEHDLEVFSLEDAELCGIEELDNYIKEWQDHSDELFGAFGAMRRLLVKEEERKGKTDC